MSTSPQNSFLFRHGPTIPKFIILISTSIARFNLFRLEKINILIDNSILENSVTHETAWISTGQELWGDQSVKTGHIARISVHPPESTTREFQQVRYLPGLISLFKSGHIGLFSSAELQFEQWSQPSGRFSGYDWYDYNLFDDTKLNSIDGHILPEFRPGWKNFPDVKEQQRLRLTSKSLNDPDYASLINVLGQKNSQDAWHIRTAEINNIFCFLTMDFKLIDAINSQRGSSRIKNLKTKVMTPEDFGRYIGLIPISPAILSYNNASFPVRSDITWPDGKRNGRKKR